MRVITLNFACCAVKDCKGKPAAFPLRPQDAELSSDEMLYDKEFLINVLPKLEWQALKSTTAALGFSELQATPPTVEDIESNETLAKDLHKVLLETEMMEGKLVCGNCGHEYQVKEGICNFLLPAHLV